jgi:rod shape determining protein RodA
MSVWSIKGQRPLTGWRSALCLRMPWSRLDWPILLVALGMVALGLVFVDHMAQADELFGHEYKISSEKQLTKALLALPSLALGLVLRPRWLRRNAYLLYGCALALLCLVPILGEERNGAKLWIPLPFGFDLQPSELVKIGLILALSRALYCNRLAEVRDWRTPAALALVPTLIVVAQPDLGTALTLVPVALGLFYLAGARRRVLAGLVAGAVLIAFAAWRFDWIQGYQKKRIDTWVSCIEPETLIENRNGAAFHLYMARTFIGNGGLTGKGLGRGVANETGHLPERGSDSIFAVIAEEGGFLGAGALVVGYLVFAALFLVAAGRTRERFSRLVIAGTGLYFAAHFAINAGVNLGLIPMTGLTLPLMSTGGSSLLVSLALLGMALGVSARAEVSLDSDSFRG